MDEAKRVKRHADDKRKANRPATDAQRLFFIVVRVGLHRRFLEDRPAGYKKKAGNNGNSQTFNPLRSYSSALFSLINSSIVRQQRRKLASRPSTAVSASSPACCTLGLSQRPWMMLS